MAVYPSGWGKKFKVQGSTFEVQSSASVGNLGRLVRPGTAGGTGLKSESPIRLSALRPLRFPRLCVKALLSNFSFSLFQRLFSEGPRKVDGRCTEGSGR